MEETRKPSCCRIDGKPCVEHEGIVHGAEAEELRAGIEKLLGERTSDHGLRELLDRVDARDSLAYLEARDREVRVDSRESLGGERLKSEDPNVRLAAIRLVHMCGSLWNDKEYGLVTLLASYALRHDVLSTKEVNRLANIGWDLSDPNA